MTRADAHPQVPGTITPRAAPAQRRTARIIIDVDVTNPAERETSDTRAVVEVEATNFVAEVFGTVFGDDHHFRRATVEWRPAQ
jgi:hypothetical protein